MLPHSILLYFQIILIFIFQSLEHRLLYQQYIQISSQQIQINSISKMTQTVGNKYQGRPILTTHTNSVSLGSIRTKVVKGAQNHQASSNVIVINGHIGSKVSDFSGTSVAGYAIMDANKMAKIQADRVREEEQAKRQKIESFMNNTRINASKLYKQQCNKNIQKQNTKKQQLDKQKQLKAKYTITSKRTQTEPQAQQKRPKQHPQIAWKAAEQAPIQMQRIHIPVENCELSDQGSECEDSGYDSEVAPERDGTPGLVMDLRGRVRKAMMDKFKRN